LFPLHGQFWRPASIVGLNFFIACYGYNGKVYTQLQFSFNNFRCYPIRSANALNLMILPFRFKPAYFAAAFILFFAEVLIALYAHDQIIRPYIGDMLVVILIYCFVKAFVNTPVTSTAVAVLIFACTVEVMQYFKIVTLLGLQRSAIARVVIGTSFEWIDLIAYTVGIAIVLLSENIIALKQGVRMQA
jgi:hypothetical protein